MSRAGEQSAPDRQTSTPVRAWAGFTLSAHSTPVLGLAGAALPAILADVAAPSIRGVAVGVDRTSSGLNLFVGPMTAGLLLEALDFEATFAIGAAALALCGAAVLFTGETLVAASPVSPPLSPLFPLSPRGVNRCT